MSEAPHWHSLLRPYQLENAEWLTELPPLVRGRVLTDGLGTGKSRSALAAMRLRFDKGLMENPVMPVFTTASSARDWAREAGRFWPELEVHVVGSGNKAQRVNETDAAFDERKHPWKQALRNVAGGKDQKPTLIVADYWWADQVGDLMMRDLDVLNDSLTLDECFVPGTLVWTPQGQVPIERLTAGMQVFAVGAEGTTVQTVEAMRDAFVSELLDLVFPTHIVKSTPNHPFLTSRGWRRADELTEGDEVVCVVPQGEGHREEPEGTLLRQKLFSQVADQSARIEADVREAGLQESASGSVVPTSAQSPQGTGSRGLEAYDGGEPDELGGNAHQGVGDASGDGPQAEDSRREREASAEGSCRTGESSRMAGRGAHHHGGSDGASELREGGHRERGDESSGRGERGLARIHQGEGRGQTEARLPRVSGLVRLQRVERRRVAEDFRGFRIHNLQVSGPNTYLVSPMGLVVHNCHLLKKAGSLRAKAINMMVSRTKQTTMLTGTPVHNRPPDLHNLLHLCEPKTPSFWSWAPKHFHIHLSDRNYQVVGKLKDRALLQASISHLVMGRTAAELMGDNMPARTYQMKYVEVPGMVRVSPAKLRAKKGEGIDKLLRDMVRHKISAAVEVARDADKPVVLYTYRREDAHKLAKALEREKLTVTMATGDQSPQARDKAIEAWKQGASQCLVCTMDAVRESATLVRADLMVFVDMHWLPTVLLQCQGRIDPARQPENERRPVTYIYIVVQGGTDEVMAEMLVEKIEQASGLGVNTKGADALGDFLRVSPAEGELERITPEQALEELVERIVVREQRMMDLEVM